MIYERVSLDVYHFFLKFNLKILITNGLFNMNTYDEIIVDIVGNVESGKSLYMVFYHILI